MVSARGPFMVWFPSLVFSLSLFLGSAPGAPAQASQPSDRAVSLPSPLEDLTRSFRTGSPGLLRTLLPGEEKIHVSSPSLGLKNGYYSGDQIYFLFQDLFRFRKTLKFNILKGAEIPPDSRRLNAVARWTYRKGNSRDFTAEISFDMVLKEGSWCIQEIREIL